MLEYGVVALHHNGGEWLKLLGAAEPASAKSSAGHQCFTKIRPAGDLAMKIRESPT
jgi:hypothetical protein